MISYKSLYGLGTEPGVSKGDIMKFKTVNRTGFNATDNIDTRFFKLLFYFYNDDASERSINVDWYNGGPTGLLAPTWLDNPRTDEYYKYNSAWAYLKNNLEDERADVLEEFISLLSQISSESPWYFKQIDGVDEALTRENWTVPEERKKITITCLNDPVDHRISSLLSMYRSIVWSHIKKCEILPANLRKFDMGLFIFSGLFNGLHVKHNKLSGSNSWYNIDYDDETNRSYASNYKYIEFTNCEISLDSIKSGFSGFNNESGFEQEFKIDIFFDDCYESEYNPFILKTFGDFFITDTFSILSRDEAGNVITPESLVNIDEDLDISWDANLGIEEQLITNRLNPFGNVDEQDQSLPTKVRTNMNDLNIPTSKKALKQKLKDEYNNLQNRIGNQVKYIKNINSSAVLNKLKRDAEKTIERALVGDLGNFYGKGMGLRGVQMTAEQELRKQVNTLSSKISGNINDAVTKIVRPISEAVAKPVKKTIEFTGSLVAKATDAIGSIAANPLDTANTISKMTPANIQNLSSTGKSYANNSNPNSLVTKSLGNTAVQRSEPGAAQKLSDTGKSYVDKEGSYNSNSSEDLGNYAGDPRDYSETEVMGNFYGEANNEHHEIGENFYGESDSTYNTSSNIGNYAGDANNEHHEIGENFYGESDSTYNTSSSIGNYAGETNNEHHEIGGNYAGETDNKYNTSSNIGNYAGEANNEHHEIGENFYGESNSTYNTSSNIGNYAGEANNEHHEIGGNYYGEPNNEHHEIGGNYYGEANSTYNITSNPENYAGEPNNEHHEIGGNYYGEANSTYDTTSNPENYAGEPNRYDAGLDKIENFYGESDNDYSTTEYLGNYVYDGPKPNSNIVGKNRLNANLGNMHQRNSMINNL